MDNNENTIVDQQEMEATINELYHELIYACDGYTLPAILIAGVALLKTIHGELLASGSELPADLSVVVSDLAAGLVPSDAAN